MRLRLLTVLAVLAAADVYAQQRVLIDGEPVIIAEPPAVPDPPDAQDAWTLQVTYTGGFTGLGLGTVTIVSDGQMTCVPRACVTKLAPARLRPVTTTIGSIVDAAWIQKPPSSFCRDCMQTTITLKRREGDAIRIDRARWDDSQSTAPELRELRRLAFDLRTASTGN